MRTFKSIYTGTYALLIDGNDAHMNILYWSSQVPPRIMMVIDAKLEK